MSQDGHTAEDLASLKDPYEVLGIQRDATPEVIRAAYRKLALQNHPDKVANRGGDPEEAAERFREISTAHGILSDPEKRRKYDTGGFKNLEPSDLDVEIDVSQLGPVSTVFASMFSRMGVPIKTAVAPAVLTAAYEGKVETTELEFGRPISDKAEKQNARFYTLNITQADIDRGFIIAANSPTQSKFKLLLFEQTPEQQWELIVQEDSAKLQKVTAAAIFRLSISTVEVGPVPSPLETKGDLEAVLFRRMDTVKERETVHLKPGSLLVAVYCDNWFKRASFSIEVLRPTSSDPDACQAVQKLDSLLLEKRDEVQRFETEFRQAQAAYIKACEQFAQKTKSVEELLSDREHAYLQLLQLDRVVEQQVAAASQGFSVNATAGSAGRYLSSLWRGSGKAPKAAEVSQP